MKPITYTYPAQGEAPAIKLRISGLEATTLYKFSRKIALETIGHMVRNGININEGGHDMPTLKILTSKHKYKEIHWGYYPISATVEVVENKEGD